MKKNIRLTRLLTLFTLALIIITSVTAKSYATYTHPENMVSSSDFIVTGTTGWEYDIVQDTMLPTDGSSTTLYIRLAPGTGNLDILNLKVYMRYGQMVDDISLIDTIDLKPAFLDGYINHTSGSVFTVTVPVDDGNGYPVEFGLNIADTDNSSYSAEYGNNVLDTLYMSFIDSDLDITAPDIVNNGVFYTDYDNLDSLSAVQDTVTAIDETDGAITPTVLTDNYSGQVTAPGDYTITFRATDSAGNSSTTTVIVRVLDITSPTVSLNGSSNVNVEYNTTYTDPGATWTDNYDGSGSNVTIAGDTVDTSTLGSYTIEYSYTDAAGNISEVVYRTVNVIDTSKPVIALIGGNITLEVGDTYTEPGATWSDDLDGTGSNVIIGGDTVDTSTIGTYTITYNYTDSNGNAATQVERIVTVSDNTNPVITLNGSTSITIEAGGTYTEVGATWSDNYDGSGSNVTIGGDTVNTSVVGTYIVTYNFTDASGNSAIEKTRTITVIDNSAPVFSGYENITSAFTSSDTIADIMTQITAHDAYDGNLTSSIVITADGYTGNEHIVGTYSVSIEVTDSNGNTTSQTFTIEVTDDYPPIIYYSDYLIPLEEANQMTQQEIIDWINSRG